MFGAIIGDIIGSRFEWNNIKSKDFALFTDKCRFTDDSVMTLAVACAIEECAGEYDDLSSLAVKYMKMFGRKYPNAGYGNRFYRWLMSEENEPYNSFGNGAGMRVSPVGFCARTIDEAKELSYKVTAVTHNHLEGIRGAEAVTLAVYLARMKKSKDEIRAYICDNYYNLDFTLDEIRENYSFDVTCQGSIPQAIMAFLESDNFEDCIRNAISIGGDSDTIAAIAGGIAEAYYGIPDKIKNGAITYLDDYLRTIINNFYSL